MEAVNQQAAGQIPGGHASRKSGSKLSDCEDAEIIITAFGTCSRICRNVIRQAAELGIKVGLIRPITLWPFPERGDRRGGRPGSVKAFLDIELNCGQMVEDVRLAVNGSKPVHFYGRTGGNLPTQREILDQIRTNSGEVSKWKKYLPEPRG